MKKRILALALAGTTAFSVFGAALSANAWDSTDTKYEVDAYVSYTPVAQTITVGVETSTANPDKYLYNYNGQWQTLTAAELDNALAVNMNVRSNYMDATVVNTSSNGAQTNYITSDLNYFVAVTAGGYTAYPLKNYLSSVFGITYRVETNDYIVKGVYTDDTNTTQKTFTKLEDAISALKALKTTQEAIKDKVSTLKVYTPTLKEISASATLTHGTTVPATVYSSVTAFTANVKYADSSAAKKDPSLVMVQPQDNTIAGKDNITVSHRYLNDNGTWTEVKDGIGENAWKAWSFNSDMTGEATVYPFEVTSNLKTDKNGNIYIESVKKDVPTIYAYDFIPETIPDSSVGNIANNWNADNLKGTTNAIGKNVMTAETGRGVPGAGIRYDVITDWEDFMEELALNDDFGYSESFSEFRANYLDMFYSDPVFDRWTGELVDYVDVDLYNIEGLLWDIWQLHERADYEAANTSELVYLMQQYDKYIGEYIDQAEVASDEWGDLLLSVLDAATEDDFRNATEYRKYQNEVEDLRDAYELATTVNMIREAEVKMYQLLVSANTRFRASANPDKAALGGTLEGLYFNVGNAPVGYSTAPSTLSTNVDYSNYNYLVAAVAGDSTVKGNNLYFGSKLSKGYYSLYPMADYMDYDTSTPNEVYAGNVANPDKVTDYTYQGAYATEEYEWFWNVYQLAANMNSNNTKQGSVDAVNDALNEAVADLAVTTTPASMDVGAMNDAVEKYAGKIDTDYNEGYYAKYTQANEYAEVAEGKWQTRIASMINGVAGEALTYQGTQVTVTKNDMKTVETAIKNGKTALEAIKDNDDYNAAQVTALNKAINEAQTIVDIYEGTYSTSKDNQSVNHVYTRLVGDKDQIVKSDLTNAIEAIDAAINYSEIVMGWSKTDAGKWQYGTEEGYLNDGWHQVDGGKTWFYFNADGTAKQSEWWNDNGTWYWFNSN